MKSFKTNDTPVSEEENEPVTYDTPIQNLVSASTKDGTYGPMIGSILIIVLILIGGLYFLGSIANQFRQAETVSPVQMEQITPESQN